MEALGDGRPAHRRGRQDCAQGSNRRRDPLGKEFLGLITLVYMTSLVFHAAHTNYSLACHLFPLYLLRGLLVEREILVIQLFLCHLAVRVAVSVRECSLVMLRLAHDDRRYEGLRQDWPEGRCR